MSGPESVAARARTRIGTRRGDCVRRARRRSPSRRSARRLIPAGPGTLCFTLFLGLSYAPRASADPSGTPATTMAQGGPAVPAGEVPALTLIAAGDHAVAYRIPHALLQVLASGSEDSPPDSLALPDPLYQSPLQGRVSEAFYLPDGDALFTTRAGCELGHLRSKAVGGNTVYLLGTDILAATRASDGTLYLLENPWRADDVAHTPKPLLSFRPERGARPDTVALLPPDAVGLCLAPGDSLLWAAHQSGRVISRLVHSGASWTASELRIPEGPAHRREDSWLLRVIPAPGTGQPLIVETAPGTRPRLLSLDSNGHLGVAHAWNKGFDIYGAAGSAESDLLVVNGVFLLCFLRTSGGEPVWIQMAPRTNMVAVSPDGQWMALARPYEAEGRSRVQIRRIGSNRFAQAWFEGSVGRMVLAPEGRLGAPPAGQRRGR